MKKIISICLVSFLMIMLLNCKKENSGDSTTTDPSLMSGEKSLQKTEDANASNGSVLTLADGSKLTVLSGMATNAKVKFQEVGNDYLYGKQNTKSYQVDGVPTGANIKLELKVAPGMNKDHVGVWNTNKNTGEVKNATFDYDKASGNTVVNSCTMTGSSAVPDLTRFIVEWDPNDPNLLAEKIIPMPYYQQFSGSCWATDGLILMMAVNPHKDPAKKIGYENILKYLGKDYDLNSGISHFYFSDMAKAYTYLSGVNFTSERYIQTTKLYNRMIGLLNNNIPVMLAMPSLGHVVLVIGYRQNQNYKDILDSTSFLIHDTKNIQNDVSGTIGSMYWVKSFAFIKQMGSWVAPYAICFPESINSTRPLQTITYPLSSEDCGYLKFVGRNKSGQFCELVRHWDYTISEGFNWAETDNSQLWTFVPGTEQKVIKTPKTFKIDAQIFNADLSKNANLRVQFNITNVRKNVITFDTTVYYPNVVPTPKNPGREKFTLSLDTSRWHKTMGDTVAEYLFKLELRDNLTGNFLDGYSFNVTANKPNTPAISGLVLPGASVQPAGMWQGKSFRFIGNNLGIKSDAANYSSFYIYIDGKQNFFSASDTAWKADGFMFYSSSGLTNGSHSIYIQYKHLENGAWVTKTSNTFTFQVISKPANPTLSGVVLTDVGGTSCKLDFNMSSNTHGPVKIWISAFHAGAGSAFYTKAGAPGQTSFTISPIPTSNIQYYIEDDWNSVGWMNPSSEGCACLRCDNRFYIIVTRTSPLQYVLNPTFPYTECQ